MKYLAGIIVVVLIVWAAAVKENAFVWTDVQDYVPYIYDNG